MTQLVNGSSQSRAQLRSPSSDPPGTTFARARVVRALVLVPVSFAAFALAACAASTPRPTTALTLAPPVPFHSTADDGTERGKLQARWEEALHREMAGFDDVTTGRLPAYEGWASIAGKRHGPMYGVVREDAVDGQPYARLRLEGDSLSLEMVPATTRQPGWFILGEGSRTMECVDCFDRGVRELALAPELSYPPRKMELTMAMPHGDVVRGHIVAGVELHTLAPATLDLARLKVLWPLLANATASGDELTLTSTAEVWVPSSAPPPDGVHTSCELEPASPATIVIDPKAPRTWTARYAGARRVCCDMARRHGPPGCGGERMDCVTSDL